MKKSYKQRLISVLLILSIGLMILVGIFSLLSGPLRSQEAIDNEIMSKFNEINKTNASVLLNRFSLSEITYIARSGDTLYAFNEQGELIARQNLVATPDIILQQLSQMNQTETDLSYGYYQDTFVYVLKSAYYELYYTYGEGKLVFTLELE